VPPRRLSEASVPHGPNGLPWRLVNHVQHCVQACRAARRIIPIGPPPHPTLHVRRTNECGREGPPREVGSHPGSFASSPQRGGLEPRQPPDYVIPTAMTASAQERTLPDHRAYPGAGAAPQGTASLQLRYRNMRSQASIHAALVFSGRDPGRGSVGWPLMIVRVVFGRGLGLNQA